MVDTNHYGATSDQSDTTYIETTGSSTKRDIQHFADPTFYSGSKINSVTYYIRATASGSGAPEKLNIMEKLSTSERTTKTSITRTTWNEYSTAAQTTAPDGGSWTYQKVTDIQAGVQVDTLGNGETISVSEIWIVVDYTPPNISNTPNTYGFGTVAESSTTETGLTHFTVTNSSGYAVNITIGGTDMTGGTTWTLSDTATPGTDICGLKAGLETGSYTIIVKKNSPYNTLVSGLADSGTQRWGLQLLAPTTFTDGGAKSGTVTLTATQF